MGSVENQYGKGVSSFFPKEKNPFKTTAIKVAKIAKPVDEIVFVYNLPFFFF